MTHPLDDARIDWDLLKRFDFDEARFRADQAAIAEGRLTNDTFLVTGTIEPASGVVDVGTRTTEARAAGEDAVRSGQVASVVLNGGMATRFGGVVKGIVEVYDSKSFIALKAEDARRAAEALGGDVPVVLMNSFATREATHEHVQANHRFGLSEKTLFEFTQSISLRLNPDGSLFIGDDGQPSYHAPGHGDFFNGIRKSKVLERLMEGGVRYLLFSNVDNLGATVDPMTIGHHILSAKAMSVEVTEKQRTASGAWDKGGAPACIDGHPPQVVEGFRFPPDFAQETLPDFSTNTMVFTAAALEQEIPLDRYVVQKKVDARPALQLETITCEASGIDRPDGTRLLELNLVRVPREGPQGRFFPVKEPVDLEANRGKLRERLESGWAAHRP